MKCSDVARAARERLPFAIFLRPFTRVAQTTERVASNDENAGENPAASTISNDE